MIKKYFAASLLITVCSVADAQSPPAGQQTPPPGQETSGSQPPQLEPSESAAASLVDGILDNTATHLGFSFSLYEMYTTNATNGLKGSQRSDGAVTTLYPQIFTNRRGRRSTLHLEYGIGYSSYHGKSALNTFSHSGSATWQIRLARYTRFALSDSFSSSPNDYGFSPGRTSQIEIQPIYSQEILVDRQRLISNSLTASVSQRVTKRINASVSGTYSYLRYGRDSFSDAQGYAIGVQADYQINNWLYLENGYSTSLNASDDKLQSSNVHRLQVGGFRYHVSRKTQFFTSASLEYTRYLSEVHTVAGFVGGLSRNTGSNSITFSYHRGLSTIRGPGSILQGHDAALSLNQRFSRRFTLQMEGSYLRGVSFAQDARSSTAVTSSLMESISAYGGLQIALQAHLVASANVGFVSQHVHNMAFVAPDLRQYAAYVGLQYFLPTLRGR